MLEFKFLNFIKIKEICNQMSSNVISNNVKMVKDTFKVTLKTPRKKN